MSKTTVYQHKDITQVTETDSMTGEEVTLWEYNEREMTPDEYAQYVIAKENTEQIIDFNTQSAIDDYTEQLIEEGVL